jgi:hypothetical protein
MRLQTHLVCVLHFLRVIKCLRFPLATGLPSGSLSSRQNLPYRLVAKRSPANDRLGKNHRQQRSTHAKHHWPTTACEATVPLGSACAASEGKGEVSQRFACLSCVMLIKLRPA